MHFYKSIDVTAQPFDLEEGPKKFQEAKSIVESLRITPAARAWLDSQ